MKNLLAILEEKKQRLAAFQPFPPEIIKNLQDWFKIELTYTSNAIEGNTLSRAQTALVVEEGLAVDGKTITEHLEALNHAEAFEWIMQRTAEKPQDINERTILDLHHLILHKIDDTNAGRYRTVPVRIAGSTVILPNAMKVPDLMAHFIDWLHTVTDHPIKTALDAHFKLVSIHPFVDGNGRTARLLLNLILLRAGYPPAIIRKEDRKEYLESIEKAQLGGSLADYTKLMYEAIDRSLDIYLKTLEGKEEAKKLEMKPLLTVGELARISGETTSTIRHWTKEGLLRVEQFSAGGYQLYSPEQAKAVPKIRTLQENQRFTLAEIKRELSY